MSDVVDLASRRPPRIVQLQDMVDDREGDNCGVCQSEDGTEHAVYLKNSADGFTGHSMTSRQAMTLALCLIRLAWEVDVKNGVEPAP